MDVLIVRIHTNEGVVGIGETQAWRRQGSSEVLGSLSYLIKSLLEPVLLDRSPFEMTSIMSKIEDVAHGSLYAQAAIGDALYDVVGKLLGVPVYTLLGGKCSDSIPVGLALGIGESPEETVDKARVAFEKGYTHLRLKIGIDPSKDLIHARQLREHFGDKVVLRADANGGMSFNEALPLLRSLEEYRLEYVEQPLPGWDLDGMAALASMLHTPISADESLSTSHSLIKIAHQKAASIIQTKTGKNGGIYRTRALWDIAHAAGIGIFPGNHPGTSIQTASVAHLCAAWPHKTLVGDFQMFATDQIDQDVVTNPMRTNAGRLPIPSGPGLGVELDLRQVDRLRIEV